LRIRWRIFSFLFGFGFLAYVQQKSITVAAERIMPELGLTQLQIALLEQAFVIGYAAFQLPGGVFGQRLGARSAFTVIGLLAFIAMMAMAVGPSILQGHAAFFGLFAAQLGLGVAQGAIFPISAGVFSAWFPPRRWAFVQGLQTMALQLGAAITPPLVVTLMAIVGWQRALVWITLPALAVIGGWAWYARNTPAEHAGVTPGELTEIGDHHGSRVDTAIGVRQLLRVLGNRDVLLLGASYLAMNYVFYLLSNWVFLYLVQERRFSALEGGWLATGPPLAAAVGAGLGGIVTGFTCARLGPCWGHRLVPLIALPTAGALLLAAVYSLNPYGAVFALALCYLTIELTEAAYWSSAMTVGGSDTMTVSGFMNTGGNLGGIVGIPIVGYLSERHDWHAAFFLGVAFALTSAAAWMGIRSAAPPSASRVEVDATAAAYGPPCEPLSDSANRA